jgi:ABC-type multidrug transport system ATPase subunit
VDASPEPVLDILNLYFFYRTLEALYGISFHIRRGRMAGFFGQNDTGKSATLKIIAGICGCFGLRNSPPFHLPAAIKK